MADHKDNPRPVTPTAFPAGVSAEAAAHNQAVANQAAEDARKRLEDHKNASVQRLDEEDKARAEAVAETERRQNASKPTPTQRENDLAKLGALDIDSKEDDGSGPEPVYQRVAVPQDGGKYKTRKV